jgi:hypothetical protein
MGDAIDTSSLSDQIHGTLNQSDEILDVAFTLRNSHIPVTVVSELIFVPSS